MRHSMVFLLFFINEMMNVQVMKEMVQLILNWRIYEVQVHHE